MFDKIKGFVAEWQDGLLWVPLVLALLLLVTAAVQWFDPRAGVDGLGFLQGYAALLLKGVLVTFMAWLCKRTYTRDASADDEVMLVARATAGQWIPLVVDRLEWLGWLVLWFALLSG